MSTSDRESASALTPADFGQRAELLQSILDQSPLGVIAHRAVRDDSGEICDFEVVAYNRKALEVVGVPEPAFGHGARLFELYPVQREYLDKLRRVVLEQVSFSEERLYEVTNRWLRLTFTPMPDGYLNTFEDITEAKTHFEELEQKNRKLEEQYHLLRSVIDNSPSGLILFEAIRDDQGRIEDFRYLLTNPSNAAVVHKSVEELEGERWLTLFPAFRGTEMEQILHDVTETGEARRLLMPVEIDAIQGWFNIQFVKQGDGVLMLFLDVTEAQLSKQEMENLNEELRRSNENLQQFAYIASHDLQEPLRKIQSFGDILQGQFGDQLGQRGMDLINRMQSAAQRMQSLVQDLLAFSRLSTDQGTFTTIDLNQLLVSVQNDLELAILKEGAQISIEPLPVIEGDTNQLRQLFQNLISNAVKFHPPDRTPRVQVRSQALPGSELPAGTPLSYSKNYVRIDIQDNGIGFDEKYLEQIFVMFQRLHGKQQYAGTGIGLAICKKIVENHEGYLTASSQPGEGATFTVILPRL
ncbi:sensor histidine kinase [Tellurirhabdus rosea]|uniref:sensor histidine kinase n=1 Tax=Tellurirhabdus rosea TaxID=2674997 RepID=UPI00224FBD1A|nr:ATP-binding protein [Tellurirhabdus rosea]